MRLGKFTKAPAEKKRYTADYKNWLDTGELLSGVVYAVTPTGGVTVPSSSIVGDGLIAAFFVDGGADGIDYTVKLTATTSGGQIKEDTVIFAVKANA